MSDNGVIMMVKESLKNVMDEMPIYMAVPPDASLPYGVMEIEEIWNHCKPSNFKGIVGKVKFSLKLVGKPSKKSSLAETSSKAANGIDGLKIPLGKSLSAVVKCVGHSLEAANDRHRRNQFYEALIWQE